MTAVRRVATVVTENGTSSPASGNSIFWAVNAYSAGTTSVRGNIHLAATTQTVSSIRGEAVPVADLRVEVGRGLA